MKMEMKKFIVGLNYKIFAMEIKDDYIRYPLKDGEEPVFENTTYADMLKAYKKALALGKQYDKEWTERVIYKLLH